MAQYAESKGEVPVGAVIIKDNVLIAEGWNQPISSKDPTAHAEVVALRQAGRLMGNYRLVDTELFVTLEPCVMCAGALMQARIKRLVYGAKDPKGGADLSVFHLLQDERFNHRIQVSGSMLADECGHILSRFFQAKRNKYSKQ